MKILFVCHGNICRSPMAEFVMKGLLMGTDPEEIRRIIKQTCSLGNRSDCFSRTVF